VDVVVRKWPDMPVIIHLSDIHFVKGMSGSALDLDADVRNELKLDLMALLADLQLPVAALVVSGDIAFQASVDEYRIAEEWLRDLAGTVKCPDGRIWAVPGNHDIDRAVAAGDLQVRAAHALLRSTDLSKLNATLTEFLQDRNMGALLLRPLERYLRFAERFGCGFTAAQPFWEHSLPLDEGLAFKVRGLTTTLVSDKDDAVREMVLGLAPATLSRIPGAEYLVVAHHPPDWLREGEEVVQQLTSRARIALFGHKHQQSLRREEDTVMLTAGAVHPYRGERPWQPRYNVLDVEVVPAAAGHERQLEVRVRPRVWRDESKRFEPEIHHGRPYRRYRFELEPWQGVGATPTPRTDLAPKTDTEVIMNLAAAAATESVPEATPMDAIVELAGRFWRLPYHVRAGVLRKLRLVSDEDRNLPEEQRVIAAFKRAREQDLLADLDVAVSEYTGQPPVGVKRRGVA